MNGWIPDWITGPYNGFLDVWQFDTLTLFATVTSLFYLRPACVLTAMALYLNRVQNFWRYIFLVRVRLSPMIGVHSIGQRDFFNCDTPPPLLVRVVLDLLSCRIMMFSQVCYNHFLGGKHDVYIMVANRNRFCDTSLNRPCCGLWCGLIDSYSSKEP